MFLYKVLRTYSTGRDSGKAEVINDFLQLFYFEKTLLLNL